jgi:allophanate hydrolase
MTPTPPGLALAHDMRARIEAAVPPAFGEIGALLVHIPPPLHLGAALLANKTAPKDFLVEAEGPRGAEDITGFGGWRGFLAARPPP